MGALGQTSPREITRHERRRNVVELRRRGKSLRAIAAELGISRAQAWKDVRYALSELDQETRNMTPQMRQLDLVRIDAALEVVQPQVEAGNLEAVPKLVMLLKRRAALLGLDAPVEVKKSVETSITIVWKGPQSAMQAAIDVTPTRVLTQGEGMAEVASNAACDTDAESTTGCGSGPTTPCDNVTDDGKSA